FKLQLIYIRYNYGLLCDTKNVNLLNKIKNGPSFIAYRACWDRPFCLIFRICSWAAMLYYHRHFDPTPPSGILKITTGGRMFPKANPVFVPDWGFAPNASGGYHKNNIPV